ncbi:retron Ec78 anti-phage system effector HNH endonuclease PtuB [Dickeya dadantii]|uniref:retron Ec78 anti-phage system effector HNH endonuclease PtuB n=1 Tax=Dickeya dadantii TaxID=204038 RepID=UPI000577FAE3|nr:retron Ec78 anti-phage system effector HNH endonuclease PtuB [Dickeya dadantii]
MKKLDRSEAPECLNQLIAGHDHWGAANKDEIWTALDAMQHGFCAYCECRLNRKHIEHFRTREEHADLIFDWANLFGSCGDTSQKGGWLRCGIYKDNGAGGYRPENLIKPDEENPSFFLHFLTTGKVRPRTGLTDAEHVRASETIRVFNLNDDTVLFNSRKQAINAELKEIEEFYSLENELTEEELDELLQETLSRVYALEFSTALTHAWSYNEQY